MSQNEKQSAPASSQKVAEFFVRILHPLTYPLFAYMIMFGQYVVDGIVMFALVRPIIMAGIASNVYKRFRKKPPFQLESKKQRLVYARALEPAAMLLGVLIWLLLSQFVFKNWATDFFVEAVLFPTLTAVVIRISWNVSLHHIALGALTTLAYFSSLSATYYWLPMLLLTAALYLGWALFQLNRNNLLQSAVGFLAGVGAILLFEMVYVPYVWDPMLVDY